MLSNLIVGNIFCASIRFVRAQEYSDPQFLDYLFWSLCIAGIFSANGAYFHLFDENFEAFFTEEVSAAVAIDGLKGNGETQIA